MPYSKPYVLDIRRPEDAEEMLRRELEEVVGDLDEVVVVFVDESAIQERGNVVRVFGGGKVRVPRINKKFYLMGGLALNGRDYAVRADGVNKEAFSRFLVGLREVNPLKTIVVVLDNHSSHWSADARWTARKLGIRLCYLPPYSLDLNPIECLWKDLKRGLAFKSIEEKEEEALEVFYSLTSDRRYTYTGSWLEKFGDTISRLIAMKPALKTKK